MESLQTTKTRLKAVKNVGQITKAMEVVAATKMRRAQETALNSRPYSYEALSLLRRVLSHCANILPITGLLVERKIAKTLVVIISSDRGLAGSFNGQVFKLADQFFSHDHLSDRPDHRYLVLAVGKKSLNYVGRKKYEVVEYFDNALDINTPEQLAELSKVLVDGFLLKKWDRVVTISTHFLTALKQDPLVRQVLPLSVDKIKETIDQIVPETGRYAHEKNNYLVGKEKESIEYILEPSPSEVLDSLLPHLVEMQIYHLFLEAKASEHSARRVAMKTASDNAIELGESLTMEYNKARQVGITRELAEITTTIMTLE